jgi:hypothetical protein
MSASARRVKTIFHWVGLATAALVIARGLLSFWPSWSGARDGALVMVDAAMIYGMMWAVGCLFARTYSDEISN